MPVGRSRRSDSAQPARTACAFRQTRRKPRGPAAPIGGTGADDRIFAADEIEALIRSGATIDGAVTAKPDAAASAPIAPNSPMS